METLLPSARQVGHLDGGTRYGGSDDIVDGDIVMTGLGGGSEDE